MSCRVCNNPECDADWPCALYPDSARPWPPADTAQPPAAPTPVLQESDAEMYFGPTGKIVTARDVIANQAERIERLLEACTFALEEIDNRYDVDEPEPGRQVEHPFPGAGAVMQRLRAVLEAR